MRKYADCMMGWKVFFSFSELDGSTQSLANEVVGEFALSFIHSICSL